MSISHKQWTIKQLLQQYIVEIPVFQRDYAQGRIGKETLRRDFLKQICNALPKDGRELEPCNLDFVYSTRGTDTIVHPLDGQQRLSTLWLLYWYVANKSGALGKDADWLRNFTYSTRSSSKSFIRALCDCTQPLAGDIRTAITQSTWFYQSWLQDPTVQAMLNTLSGLDDKKDDGIEPVLEDFDFMRLWTYLSGNDCAIRFDFLDITDDDIPQPDVLYVKMNARGKQLDDFENFKADLIGHMRDNWSDDSLMVDTAAHMDNEWLDVFWEGNLTPVLNRRMLSFFTRYFLCRQILKDEKADKGALYKADIAQSANSSYLFEYKGLDDFTANGVTLLSEDEFKLLTTVFLNIKSLGGYTFMKDLIPSFLKGCQILPEISEIDDSQVKCISMKQFAYFYGSILYLEKAMEVDGISFKRWMRIVGNLAENSNESSTFDGLVGIMRLLKELSDHCREIYTYLANPELKIESRAADKQIQEEIAKATKLWESFHGDAKDSISEEEIIEAEDNLFFRGQIRGLMYDADGNLDWADFRTKYATAKALFVERAETEVGGIKQLFEDGAYLRLFFSRFTSEQYEKKLYWCHRVFNNKVSTWRTLINSRMLSRPVHYLLLQPNDSPKLWYRQDETTASIMHALVETPLLDFVVEKIPNSWIRPYHGHIAIFPSGTGVFLDARCRDAFFAEKLTSITVDSNALIKDTDYLFGSDIYFDYEYDGNLYHMIWYRDNRIYLLNKNKEKEIHYREDGTEEYYSQLIKEMKSSDILKELASIVEQFKSDCVRSHYSY